MASTTRKSTNGNFPSALLDSQIDRIAGDELARTINQLVSDTEVAAAQINDGCPFQAQ